ncbi:DUF1972 domain-containing protein [Paenibacillus sp. 453mf]|uniref:DUF1972 domain-containing protein n=1 Tax=Paenibacillus sp. 453mf TaxID=1761874 RepID=UPI0008F26A8C|nr:DUF1972 domain-containing protein [Paenibacillus sp. 453mf]SFS38901.1 Glycosyltransferase, GT2 family [Paenibacillus sp. 453mf]
MSDYSKKRVAFCGTRGLPANYGGFETAVDEISKRMVSQGYECTIFCRGVETRKQEYEGRILKFVKGSKNSKLDTFFSSLQTARYLYKNRRDFDYILWFNNANLPGILLSLMIGLPVAVNTDGLEWRRAKWSPPFKLYYFLSSLIISLFVKVLISDSRSIQEYYKSVFRKETEFIPYGVPEKVEFGFEDVPQKVLDKYNVVSNKYFLQITRFEPDNLPLEIITSFKASKLYEQGYKFVLVGYKHDSDYVSKILQMSGTNGIEVHPANYDPKELFILRKNAFCYLHGNSVGGTNPALLEAMQSCKRVLAIDGPFSREVLGNNGMLFKIDNLFEMFVQVLSMEEQSIEMSKRLKTSYDWDAVSDAYINLTEKRASNYFVHYNDSPEKKVGIILVNYNGYEDTLSCIDSLMEMSYLNKKIYLVDNCSPDHSGKKLQEYYSSYSTSTIEVILLNYNSGFSGGNNPAIKMAMSEGCEFIWLLNNDTIVDKNALRNLSLTLDKNPNVGMVGSKIYFYESNKIWYAGGGINKLALISHRGADVEDTKGYLYNNSCITDYITGCSLLTRATLIEEIGLLDEDFFLYYEDTEYSVRARRAGWKLLYEPNSILWHKVSASTGSNFRDHAPILDYYDIRNNVFFIRKCYPRSQRFLPYCGVFIKIVKKHVRLLVRPETRKLEKLKQIYKGIYDAAVYKRHNTVVKTDAPYLEE